MSDPRVEPVAKALHKSWGTPWDWERASEDEREGARVQARVALAAVDAATPTSESTLDPRDTAIVAVLDVARRLEQHGSRHLTLWGAEIRQALSGVASTAPLAAEYVVTTIATLDDGSLRVHSYKAASRHKAQRMRNDVLARHSGRVRAFANKIIDMDALNAALRAEETAKAATAATDDDRVLES